MRHATVACWLTWRMPVDYGEGVRVGCVCLLKTAQTAGHPFNRLEDTTMKTNFTPGPWTITARAKGLAINGPRSTVCTIGFLDDQGMADAELIASAPDLLYLVAEAAKMLRLELRDITPGSAAHSLLADIDLVYRKATGNAGLMETVK